MRFDTTSAVVDDPRIAQWAPWEGLCQVLPSLAIRLSEKLNIA